MMWLDGSEHNFLLRDIWEPAPQQTGVQFVDKSRLSDMDSNRFEKIAKVIRDPEFVKWYKDRDPNVGRYYGFEYWLKANIMYRRPVSE